MRRTVVVGVIFLCGVANLWGDDALGRAIEGFLESAPLPLFYWGEPFGGYLQTTPLSPGSFYFSPYRIQIDEETDYGIARSELVSLARAYFWYLPPETGNAGEIRVASGEPVHEVSGAAGRGSQVNFDDVLTEAISLSREYRRLERDYLPGFGYTMLGAGALSGGLAYLFYRIWPYDTINPLSTMYGAAGAIFAGMGVYTMIQNPIIKRKMDDRLARFDELWAVQPAH